MNCIALNNFAEEAWGRADRLYSTLSWISHKERINTQRRKT